MPELISKYRVFLASPSDLDEERDAVSEVISELNLTYGNPNNIVIELLKWETNSAPGISNISLQNIVNTDIPAYDLFIGLLWMRFGTPTAEFGSGTEEEFNIAHERFIKDNKSIQILFYFKNSPPHSLDMINPEQLSKIMSFKTSLGEKNILHWEFNALEELQRFLRIHIPTRINELMNNSSTIKEPKISIDTDDIQIQEYEDEYGVLDYQEVIQESFSTSTDALSRISSAMEWIGNEMNKKTKEIERLMKANNGQPLSYKVQRNIYSRTAVAMDEFASRVEPEIPIYINNFENGIDAFAKMAMIYKSDFEGKEDEIEEAKIALESLLIQIEGGVDSMVNFCDTVDNLPRMSKELNKARSNVSEKIRDMISKIQISHSIATEVYKSL
ncbi:DUF4062 domain-containing protein [Flavobacterium sp. 3HN19-14]|uniref:DUF4062 domain-containing protein n=1 Tax=Flavobacterium sp. 3HN19-14 TaxID=3448133 RepID=UPI003EE3D8B0